MTDTNRNLGKLLAVHGIAPAQLQRALFTIVLAFLFFLAMMFAYYIRQSLGYFLLASAFLVVYLITLFSWVMQRRNLVNVHENGLMYKDRPVPWNEIETVGEDGVICVRGEKPITLPKTLDGLDMLVDQIRQKTGDFRP